GFKDHEQLAELWAQHILDPMDFDYSETVSGPGMCIDTDALKKAHPFISATRDAVQNASIPQKVAEAALDRIARANEEAWKLADARKEWSASKGKMIRAMLAH
ncbi:unnamed protein product, partial [Prorocentrum cordatum]